MKTFLVGFILLVALFICLPYHVYLRQLWKKNPEKSWKKARRFVAGFFNLELFLSGCKLEVRGSENIPEDTPCLFVGNHRSYFDILAYHRAIRKPCGFIAKKEMLRLPLLPLYMDDIGCLFLDRDNLREGMKTINQAAEYIKLGHSMILFPEGHRNQSDTLLPFKEGGYKIADKAKCPIVPMAVSGSDLLLESAPNKLVHSSKIIIEFGKPIYPADMPPKEKRAELARLPEIIQGMRDTHEI